MSIDTYNNDTLENASPDSVFNAQTHPKHKVLKGLKEWAKIEDGFKAKALEANLEWLKNEVLHS